MATMNLASLHSVLLGIERGDDLGWAWSERLPDWALWASASLVADVVTQMGAVRVFRGPWMGLRVLARQGDGWVHALISPPRKQPVARRGLSHRLATPPPRAR